MCVCYLNKLPDEILEIIFSESKTLFYGKEWNNAILYNIMYDTCSQNRKFRTKTIYKYDYYTRSWIYWTKII